MPSQSARLTNTPLCGANTPLPEQDSTDIIKVAILGAESTGKTTLCQDLAHHFDTAWVLEYMRPYCQQKWDTQQIVCEWSDLMPIAAGQINLENQQAAVANRYLFCDTTLVELMVYAYWYYDKCPTAIEQAAMSHHYDLILLTETDVPWVADDLREGPQNRELITQALADTLKQLNKPYQRIGGDRQTRVNKVAQLLNNV